MSDEVRRDFPIHGESRDRLQHPANPHLTDSERGRLRELHFGEAKNAHYEVNSKVVEVYDKMLAKNLPCVMIIGISKPLTRQQGDVLNAQRTTIANLAGTAFTAAAKAVAPLTWRYL